jgi:hypothetical protein
MGEEIFDNYFTAVFDQTRHKKDSRAKPRNGFCILICGGFESKCCKFSGKRLPANGADFTAKNVMIRLFCAVTR